MRKLSKISGQATSLGVASLLTLAVWSSVAHTQEPSTTDKPAAAPAKPMGAPPPGLKARPDKIGPDASGPEGKSKENKESKAKAGPVSRAEAIEHYRSAQKTLGDVPEPADPKSPAADEARKGRRDALRELRRARDEILRSHNDARREFQKRDPEDVEGLRKKVSERTNDLRKDRKDRSQKARDEIEKVVGNKPLHPAVKEELRSHAWRLARLNQLIYLAELDKRPQLADKAKDLIDKENTAHQERLKKLLAKPEVKSYKPPPPPPESKDKDKPALNSKLPPNHPLVPGAGPVAPPKPAGGAQ